MNLRQWETHIDIDIYRFISNAVVSHVVAKETT